MCTRLHITCELCFTVHSRKNRKVKMNHPYDNIIQSFNSADRCPHLQQAPPTMDILFKPVVSLLGNLQQVTQFQITNMQRVVRHLKAKVAKQKELLAQARIELAKARDYKW
ncbi:uncharacterized protein BYT42DRAFT_584093 [Radiomyces spectabilis]|uniref:uncharacterized protein n=1 Tax=Radiomyces spectabilis TaxID=64574 RepID=UPI0022206321|nr:uncharacterized protein BYT42DRAFT_584093 [Radiomyces spectabilis]KAI8369363.1 hypothetical protein BYT42DRAFT_584093 [Radiomyces spectabilis]